MEEDDLKWVENEKKILLSFNCFMKIFVLKPIDFKETESFLKDTKCFNTAIVILSNHCYLKQNVCLNIKICKCLVTN